MNIRFIYPEGRRKALTFSYDDGQIFDRRLVAVFNQYGMKGTFHLNSGNLGDGQPGEQDTYVTKEELKQLYDGHEIACHGVYHRNPTLLSIPQMAAEIGDDRKNLEGLTGGFVQGMSYAFGRYSEEIKRLAGSLGILYSRTVNDTMGFFPPADFLEWHPTCHHSRNLLELGRQFLSVPDYCELPLMYVWGHSFEFGHSGDWSVMEQFCELMHGKEDIWYATNMEIYRYLTAVRSLELSADGTKLHNPSATDVWFMNGEKQRIAKAGEITVI